MDAELEVACGFFATLLESSEVPAEKAVQFCEILSTTFRACYEASWYPDQPFRGSGNRCIRVHPFKMDPLVAEVAELAGIGNIHEVLPQDLTLWVDPNCVCYRFGERTPIFHLYNDEQANSPILSGHSSLSPPTHTLLSPSSSPTQHHYSFASGFSSPHTVPQHYGGNMYSESSQNGNGFLAVTLNA